MAVTWGSAPDSSTVIGWASTSSNYQSVTETNKNGYVTGKYGYFITCARSRLTDNRICIRFYLYAKDENFNENQTIAWTPWVGSELGPTSNVSVAGNFNTIKYTWYAYLPAFYSETTIKAGINHNSQAVGNHYVTFPRPDSLWPTTYINVDGVWKVAEVKLNVNGTWKDSGMLVNVNGTWK